jgi:hypothetical protein
MRVLVQSVLGLLSRVVTAIYSTPNHAFSFGTTVFLFKYTYLLHVPTLFSHLQARSTTKIESRCITTLPYHVRRRFEAICVKYSFDVEVFNIFHCTVFTYMVRPGIAG